MSSGPDASPSVAKLKPRLAVLPPVRKLPATEPGTRAGGSLDAVRVDADAPDAARGEAEAVEAPRMAVGAAEAVSGVAPAPFACLCAYRPLWQLLAH